MLLEWGMAETVSIHAPAGGATAMYGPGGIQERVSIHAPAGGATESPPDRRRLPQVSIHAPAGGATPRLTPHKWESSGFNPRSRGGSDG